MSEVYSDAGQQQETAFAKSDVQSVAQASEASLDSGGVDGQALAQLESLQLDVRAALAAAQDAQGSGPILQDSLAKVTTLLETMVGITHIPTCLCLNYRLHGSGANDRQ